MRTVLRATLFVALALTFPGAALGGTSAGQPFPTNLYTVPDATQITGLRVDLAKPDCTTHPSDCADVAVLDTLDGFNTNRGSRSRSRGRSISPPCRARRCSWSVPATTSSASTRSFGSR